MDEQAKKITESRNSILRRCAIFMPLILLIAIVGCDPVTDNDPTTIVGFAPGAAGIRRVDSGNAYFFYEGPVFPLTVLNETEGITAVRDIGFDFSGKGSIKADKYGPRPDFFDNIVVTDSYELFNGGEADKSIKLLYPFASSYSYLHMLRPAITAAGVTLETGLSAGSYSGGFQGGGGAYDLDWTMNLKQLSSWEEYVALLSDGAYQKHALGDSAQLDQKVTVYEVTNIHSGDYTPAASVMAVDYRIDAGRSTILSYGFHGMDDEIKPGYARRILGVPREDGFNTLNRFLIIVIGDDIGDLSVKGYQNSGCHEGEEVNSATADITRYEAVLSDILYEPLNDYMAYTYVYLNGDGYYSGEEYDMDSLHRALSELLCEYGPLAEKTPWRYSYGNLGEMIRDIMGMSRVFYLTADLAVAAGKSVPLTVTMTKPGSCDIYGPKPLNINAYGYDMLTKFGSALRFDEITAGIAGAEYINIVKQNFGFDPANGISNVTLDPQIPQYYMEVEFLTK